MMTLALVESSRVKTLALVASSCVMTFGSIILCDDHFTDLAW